MFFKRNKETPAEKAARLGRIHADMEQFCSQGKDKYDKLVAEVQQVLNSANKPTECNTIRFVNVPYLFPKLKSFQYDTDWNIWKSNGTLYLYREEVEDYPEEYYGGDAPAIAAIPIDSIQQFRVEGSAYVETKISGGKVAQNMHTGRITQTALKSKTIPHDTRIVRMSVFVDGVIKFLEFDYSAFDILCVLIPDKEHK